jgi:hypothetical protein
LEHFEANVEGNVHQMLSECADHHKGTTSCITGDEPGWSGSIDGVKKGRGLELSEWNLRNLARQQFPTDVIGDRLRMDL